MHVLILAVYYLPSQKSVAKHIHDLGIEFRQQGHQVTILTTTHEIARSLEVTIEEGLQIARVKTGRIEGASKPLRAIREIRISALLWQNARNFLLQNPADLIVFYSPTIFFGTLVRRLKSRWRCPTYLILRDIFPQWAVDAGALRRGFIYRFFRRKEIEQYEAADVIAVQSSGDLKYFALNFSAKNYRLEVLSNWTALYEPDLPQTQYRAQLGLQDKVVFLYGGNLGIAQDVDNIIRLACALASHPKVYFLLVGEGSEAPRLRKLITENRLRNVQVMPPVEQRTYLSMVREFDVGLITLDRRLSTHNIPGKLLGYMYWGMPVLCSVNPGNDLFEMIGKGQVGFCVANGEDEKLRAAALQLATDAQLRARMGNNARLMLEETFSAKAAVWQILHHLSETPQFAAQVEVAPTVRS